MDPQFFQFALQCTPISMAVLYLTKKYVLPLVVPALLLRTLYYIHMYSLSFYFLISLWLYCSILILVSILSASF
jgi:hypothetical protein